MSRGRQCLLSNAIVGLDCCLHSEVEQDFWLACQAGRTAGKALFTLTFTQVESQAVFFIRQYNSLDSAVGQTSRLGSQLRQCHCLESFSSEAILQRNTWLKLAFLPGQAFEWSLMLGCYLDSGQAEQVPTLQRWMVAGIFLFKGKLGQVLRLNSVAIQTLKTGRNFCHGSGSDHLVFFTQYHLCQDIIKITVSLTVNSAIFLCSSPAIIASVFSMRQDRNGLSGSISQCQGSWLSTQALFSHYRNCKLQGILGHYESRAMLSK